MEGTEGKEGNGPRPNTASSNGQSAPLPPATSHFAHKTREMEEEQEEAGAAGQVQLHQPNPTQHLRVRWEQRLDENGRRQRQRQRTPALEGKEEDKKKKKKNHSRGKTQWPTLKFPFNKSNPRPGRQPPPPSPPLSQSLIRRELPELGSAAEYFTTSSFFNRTTTVVVALSNYRLSLVVRSTTAAVTRGASRPLPRCLLAVASHCPSACPVVQGLTRLSLHRFRYVLVNYSPAPLAMQQMTAALRDGQLYPPGTGGTHTAAQMQYFFRPPGQSQTRERQRQRRSAATANAFPYLGAQRRDACGTEYTSPLMHL